MKGYALKLILRRNMVYFFMGFYEVSAWHNYGLHDKRN